MSGISSILYRYNAIGQHWGQSLVAALDLFDKWLERSRQRRSLLALDDRLLRDIGISRADAEGEGSKRFWQP